MRGCLRLRQIELNQITHLMRALIRFHVRDDITERVVDEVGLDTQDTLSDSKRRPGFQRQYRKQSSTSAKSAVSAAEVTRERLVGRSHCEHLAEVTAFVSDLGLRPDSHQACSEPDVAALLQSNIGVSIMPLSSAGRLGVRSLDLEGFNVSRTLCVYAVAGRQRSMPASTFIKMLRAADWSTIEPQFSASVSKVA